MTSTVDPKMISQHIIFYTHLFQVLESQMATMEQDFFEVSTVELTK